MPHGSPLPKVRGEPRATTWLIYYTIMLRLHAPTSERWLQRIRPHLDELLIDHAHCEKKAAGTAMNMLFAYVDRVPLTRELTDIVREELDHFHQVLDLLGRRGVRFRRLAPSNYGARLHALIRKEEPGRGIDRMLVAGLIEARSCERFGLLRDDLQTSDAELSGFYESLFEAEARHHASYVRLALAFGDDETVRSRLLELSAAEADIIAEGDPRPRMHG